MSSEPTSLQAMTDRELAALLPARDLCTIPGVETEYAVREWRRRHGHERGPSRRRGVLPPPEHRFASGPSRVAAPAAKPSPASDADLATAARNDQPPTAAPLPGAVAGALDTGGNRDGR